MACNTLQNKIFCARKTNEEAVKFNNRQQA